jgi:hypothetical protein
MSDELNAAAKMDLSLIDLKVHADAVCDAARIAILGLLDVAEAAAESNPEVAELAMNRAEAAIAGLLPLLDQGTGP